MCGEENLNYSPYEAMAPPMGLKPMRMCISFPLFQLGHAKKGKKIHMTRIGLNYLDFQSEIRES